MFIGLFPAVAGATKGNNINHGQVCGPRFQYM